MTETNPLLWCVMHDGTIHGSPLDPTRDAVLTLEMLRSMLRELERRTDTKDDTCPTFP